MKLASAIKDIGLMAVGRTLSLPPLGGKVAAAADRSGPLFQILVYHRVLPERDPFAISPVSVREFDAQMSLLRSCFNVVSLDRLVEDLDAGRLKPGTVSVTFDDGYRDNHDHALPILRKHGLPAAVYLATGFMGTDDCPWYDKVLGAMRNATAEKLDFEPAGFRGEPIADKGRRAQAAYKLLEWFKRFAPAERDAQIADLAKAVRPKDGGAHGLNRLMLEWGEVRAMHQAGITFGGHTVTHPILSKLDAPGMEAEIRGSQAAIEEALQAPVRHFAYPNGRTGDYGEDTIAILKKLGFASSVTTNHGVNRPGQDRYQWLRRQPWERDTGGMYARMVMERLSA